jgi:hypothetical protein
MRRKFTRVLVLVSLCLVMIGFRTAERTAAQGGLAVGPTTGTYPGAPRSVAVLDVTLPSGQHLWFDRDLCRTFAWKDTDNTTTLSNPVATGSRWPAPDITVFRDFPGLYGDTTGALWASDWGTWWQPHFQGYTTTGDSVTFTCDHPAAEGQRYTAALTYTGVTRPAGTGYTLTATVTPAAGVSGLGLWTRQTGLGGIGGDSTDLMAWSWNGDGWGLQGLPYLHGVELKWEEETAFWAILTHPQGSIVVEQPNLYDANSFIGTFYAAAWDHGFTVTRPTNGGFVGSARVSDPVAFLANRTPGRTAPQQYLDARYALVQGWNQLFGLGPQHMPLEREGGGGGWLAFTQLAQLGTWQNHYDRNLDWGERVLLLSATVGHYVSPDGTAAGINASTELEGEIYLPSASDLPGLVPAPNGQTYTLGTLAELRQGLDVMRLLGLVGAYWSQWTYWRGDGTGQERSHFNVNSLRSVFWDQHPEWSLGCPQDCYPNYNAPGYVDWLKDWSTQYWLSQGMQGKFMDTANIVPDLGGPSQRAFIDFNIWYLRQNGFINAEMPQSWYGPLWYNQGSPYALFGREWGAPFSASSPRFRTCGGFDNTICEAATAGRYAEGVEYNLDTARRLHSIGAGWGNGGLDKKWAEYDYEAAGHPGHVAAAQAAAHRFSTLQDQYGHPERVELVNPQRTTNPYPIRVAESAGPDTRVLVHPIYQLPQAGVIQIDDEQIRYRHQHGDVGLQSGVGELFEADRGWNGTTPASHSLGAPVTFVGTNPLHWTYDDAYWVYGTGSNEQWVRYSDGSVWQPGGSVAAALPGVTNVTVAAGGSSSATITYTTDVPVSTWIDYDTYGSAEAHNADRPADWWPTYLHKTNLDDPGAPPLATSHSRTLPALTPGALYHYSVVAQGPAQTRTQDATFVAGAQAPTSSITASPSTVAPGGPVTLTIHDGAPADWHAWGRVGQTTNEWGFLDCGQTGPNPPGLTDASCTLPAPTVPGTYTYGLFDNDPARTMLAASNAITVVAPPTATPVPPSTPTRTATATATPLPTATPPPTATPVLCVQVRLVAGSEVAEPCP